jgi:hypothetical protein
VTFSYHVYHKAFPLLFCFSLIASVECHGIANLTNAIATGEVDPSDLLSNLEEQITQAKQEASKRKEILEKMEKWMSACEEEGWLEDYNKVWS